ncbi:MAG: glycosyltransferase [Deltaproteobacteria bacterium]|nr:glycosyltransferase [Deltaproteobacteria bacterium]
MSPPVSIVIPMYNAERHVKNVLDAIFDQDYQGPVEVIVVNDGSRDRSLEIARTFQGRGGLTIIDQPNQGAVAATNNGFKAARYDIICSVDSDVVLHKDWLRKIMEEFDDPVVGTVQGYYKTPQGVSLWARMMGYDVEARYDSIPSKYVTQVCTGDTAYRKSAIEKTGLFDPAFKYGYDNDMSYRLQKAGYKLVFRKDALCDHYWKADFKGYIKQQYHSAYGRMQLIQKHRERIAGDSVSGIRMIMQAPLTLLCFILFVATACLPFTAYAYIGGYFLFGAFGILGLILTDRFVFAVGVFRKQKDPTSLFLPLVHLLRNVVWCWAMLKWSLKSGLSR